MRTARLAVGIACCLVTSLTAVAARGQAPTIMTQAYAWQRWDVDVPSGGTVQPFASTPVQNCYAYHQNSGLNTTSLSCLLANTGYNGFAGVVPLGSESATVNAFAQVDPLAGTIKSSAAIDANGFVLSQFVPTVDQNGVRVFTGDPKPDVLAAFSQYGMIDRGTFAVYGPWHPATIDLAIDWSGTMYTPGNLGMVQAFSSAQLQFCVGLYGHCFDGDPSNDDDLLEAWTTVEADGANTSTGLYPIVYTGIHGGMGQTLSFVGSANTVRTPNNDATVTTVNGTFYIKKLPFAYPALDLDFGIWGWNQTEFRHQRANYPDCDPNDVTFGDCFTTSWPPTSIVGSISSDFSHTVSMRSYSVFDASGRDITRATSLTFGSGLVIAQNPNAPTLTPEPATLLLTGIGLLAVGAIARRPRA